MSSLHFRPRDVAMKDSWSHGDDRRDRGRSDRVDRGVPSRRRSPSPPPRRPEGDRHGEARDRGVDKSRPYTRQEDRRRERSPERRRPVSRSPVRNSREEVRQRNRGRELLDTRSAGQSKDDSNHTSSSKRQKSRSRSRERSHRKKSRRSRSRSPAPQDSRSGRSDRPRRPESPARRRSPDRRDTSRNTSDRSRIDRGFKDSDRSRQTSDRRDRPPSRERRTSPRRDFETRKRSRSRVLDPLPPNRPRSPYTSESGRDRRGLDPKSRRGRTPDLDRYEPLTRSRAESRGSNRGSRRGSPPRNSRRRDEHRPDSRPSSSGRGKGLATASGANSIEVPSRGNPSEGANSIEITNPRQRSERAASSGRGAEVLEQASGANSIEVSDSKMAGRGFGYNGYQNPNQQMQAAFPMQQPRYSQGPPQQQQIDTRFSQSPHHMSPNHSYHNSPQAQSPFSAGRGGWDQQQQFSPRQQYPPNYGPQGPYPPTGPQGYYPQQSPSPQYHGQMQQQQQPPTPSFRGGSRGGFRGTPQNQHHNQRGNFRGRGGFSNNMGGNGHSVPSVPSQAYQSGHSTPQHVNGGSPAFQQGSSQASPDPVPQKNQPESQPQANPDEEDDDLFRPSKELQVEDTEKPDKEKMPPPAAPTGPAAAKGGFSFAFKASSKAPAAAPKPEIANKLTAVPNKAPPTQPARDARSPPRGPSGPRSAIPTEPASVRNRPDTRREPQQREQQRESPQIRKIKKIMRRPKARPTLPTEFAASDSVYYRKPGNESVVGSGTYGKVFKAIHVYTKKLVALKKIRMEGERDGFPVTAVREIKLLQSLKHRNIVNLQEVMVEKNDCFMVFEYLSHDLTGLLNHPSFKLDPAQKKDLAKQMFEGLDYLHRRGVLHRDIKAANILVSNEGLLKIADFGLARFYAKRKQLDYTNRVITIWYRSPELLLGETQYDGAVDIWSAACVLVEIFTRHAIFPGDGGEISQLEKIYNIIGTPNVRDWPGLVDMAWFELLRPSAKKTNVFAEKYKDRVTPAAFDLLEAMFQYDPVKRPTASDVLEHPYFTTEEPASRQAIELQTLEGDWHEFESKALRKENEKKERESRRAQQKETSSLKEKKRAPEEEAAERENKRQHTEPPSAVSGDIVMTEG